MRHLCNKVNLNIFSLLIVQRIFCKDGKRGGYRGFIHSHNNTAGASIRPRSPQGLLCKRSENRYPISYLCK